jgi:glycosyltransferase involved in cell wall biosynthesis
VEQGFGFSQLPKAVETVKPHIVFLYNDIGVIKTYMEKLGETPAYKIWLYVDQIYETIPVSGVTVLNKADRVFCFTKAWKDLFKKVGVTKPIDVLTHGFDRDLFPVIPRDDARTLMKIPKDVFLFINVNRNQPRKHYDLLVMAFVELILKHPEKPIFLMCVCDNGETGGYLLFDIFANELGKRGASVDLFANRMIQSSRSLTFTDEEMGLFYQVADAGVTCTDGEGFGLCAFESMGLGVPQVLPAILGHREFCTHENSQLVEPAFRLYNPLSISPYGGEAPLVDYKEFATAMESYVLNPELRAAHGVAAANTVREYIWPTVLTSFLKRLELLYNELVLDNL